MDYLIVPSADDGTWFDEPDTAIGLEQARQVAVAKWGGRVPRGYEITIYRIEYVEVVEMPATAEAWAAKAGVLATWCAPHD